jgi:hypothetical protein
MKGAAMKKMLSSLLVLSPAIAGADAPRGSSYAQPIVADDAPAPVHTIVSEDTSAADLRVKRMPVKQLRMRTGKQVAAAGKGAADGAAAPADDGSTRVGYKMFPTTARDLRERVAFRIRAGAELDNAPASARRCAAASRCRMASPTTARGSRATP